MKFESLPGFSFAARPLFDEGRWTCRVLSLETCEGYCKVTLDTSKEIIHFMCGNGGYNWVFFPHNGYGCVLANYNDYEYNYMQLSGLYDDVDTTSIIYCLSNILDFVNEALKKENSA